MIRKLFLTAMLGLLTLASAKEPGVDHPMVSRYADSVMVYHKHNDYDEGVVPLGKLKGDNQFEKKLDFEGRLSAYKYKNPPGRSTLEIMKNYEQALQSNGFTIVWKCKNEAECGRGSINTIPNIDKFYTMWFINDNHMRTMTGKLTKNGKSVYLYLYVNQAETYLTVFESKGMEMGMVSADALASEMQEKGKVSLQINFDTAKATIQPDSRPILKEAATLLERYPAMRVSIEGHTDSDGGEAKNQTLSEERAKAVKRALAEEGIAEERMETKGFGESAPVAGNDSEEGKAQNRRVEIVNLTPDALGAESSQEAARQAPGSDSDEGGLWSRLTGTLGQSGQPEESDSRIGKKLDQKQEQVTDRIIDKSVDTAVDSLIKSLF